MSGRKKITPQDLLAERKQDHLDLCLREDVSAEHKTTLLEEVELIHEALPEVSYDQLDTSRKWLGKKLAVPLIITGMTGGTRQAFAVNPTGLTCALPPPEHTPAACVAELFHLVSSDLVAHTSRHSGSDRRPRNSEAEPALEGDKSGASVRSQ